MAVKGMGGMSDEQVRSELQRGARFVVYTYVFSILIMTYKRGSAVHFIKADEGTFLKGLPSTFISLIFGWWGIPWGLIYTFQALYQNSVGGRDVTNEILSAMRHH